MRRRCGLLCALALAVACSGEEPEAGVIEGRRRTHEALRRGEAAQDAGSLAVHALGPDGALADRAPDARPPKRILFGDLHVHTTFSIDAFLNTLPLFGGGGAHPPADACDFARHCSQVDFFALTDHAEAMTPGMWGEIKRSMRECNERAGGPGDPDLVAFTGWEWTQVGPTPETHYGHKNVIFPGLAEDELPVRPITSLEHDVMQRARGLWYLPLLQGIRVFGLGPYADFLSRIQRLAELPSCEAGVDTRALPPDCRENAPTPGELFEKLAQWGFPTLVIPHGLTWGLHTPPGANLDVQLSRAQHDPEMQRLLEVFSGHGNSEEYRPWRASEVASDGEPVCPEPSADFLPCCWRAGEIMRERCGDLPAAECERRVAQARRAALAAGSHPHWVFPDARAEDWLDCDQCRDCFKPAMSLRPRQSAQYGAAIAKFDERDASGRPLRFRWGFVSSSDNHSARPGTGYKQVERQEMTDARGIVSERGERILRRAVFGKPDPQQAVAEEAGPPGLRNLIDSERVASFMYPGGLVGVHARGRDRGAIWDALMDKEVYGTSGPRILLWFDLVNGPGGRVPMGGEVALSEAPRFEVRAVGSFVQQPGCPAESEVGLPAARLERLCRGECYYPSDARHPIVAIEVVRIRPQVRPGESVDPLIEDPWLRHDCPPDPAGCVFAFEDPAFAAADRDAVYYVRALQEQTPAINAANLRTVFDAQGEVVSVDPCYGSYRTPTEAQCLAPTRERAWSSPIYVDRARPR